jgi:4-amino-4-deoxy-L-arabinose transferase-like glycosyltransferase
LLGWLPWSIIAIAALLAALWQLRNPVADTLRSFLLIWIGVVVMFFSLSQSKLPGYVLPAVPAGAVLISRFICAQSSEKVSTSLGFLVAAGHALLSGALVFAGLVIQYLVLEHRVPWGSAVVPLTVAIVLAIAICALLIKSDLRALRIATLVPTILGFAIAVRFGALPLDETLSARPVADELAPLDPHHLPLAVFLAPRETEFGLAFYRNQVISNYQTRQIPSGEHIVVAARGFQRSIARESGRKVTYLGNFAPQQLEYFYVVAH